MYEVSVGNSTAVITTEPWVGGFQEQVIEVETARLIQPGILLPFAENVMTPGLPTLAVIPITDPFVAEETFPAIESVTVVGPGSLNNVIVT